MISPILKHSSAASKPIFIARAAPILLRNIYSLQKISIGSPKLLMAKNNLEAQRNKEFSTFSFASKQKKQHGDIFQIAKKADKKADANAVETKTADLSDGTVLTTKNPGSSNTNNTKTIPETTTASTVSEASNLKRLSTNASGTTNPAAAVGASRATEPVSEINSSIQQQSQPQSQSHQDTQQLRRKEIDETIESLRRRIDKDANGLERTLEQLQAPPPPKPTIADFKWPFFNTFLLASIVYYIMQYTWEYLEYEEKEKQYQLKVAELEAKVATLQLKNKETEELQGRNSESKDGGRSKGWKRFFWW